MQLVWLIWALCLSQKYLELPVPAEKIELDVVGGCAKQCTIKVGLIDSLAKKLKVAPC